MRIITAFTLLTASIFILAAQPCVLAAEKTAERSKKASQAKTAEQLKKNGWISLFNGKNLDGWKASEHKDSFKVVDGELVVHGDRGHLFYDGPVEDANFKNFKWRCDIKLKPKTNSGMYIHTNYQEDGWPSQGYEIQVNNTHSDPKKTGGIYGIVDVMDHSPAKDGEWFTQLVIVKGKHITVKVNGKTTAEYTEPDNVKEEKNRGGRFLSSGTVAIQAHDPGSEAHYKNIMIKPLP